MTTEETKAYLREKATLLDSEVLRFLDQEKLYSKEISPVAHEVLVFAESACIGGKRIRGTFVMTAVEMFGKEITPAVIRIAAITELIHSAILVFDDVIDDSPLRHGHPTVHAEYYERYKSRPGAYLFGQGVGLSIALVLEHVVFDEVGKVDLPAELKVQLYQHLHRSFANTAYGELLDVYSFVYDNPSEEHILKVLDYKTAKYTYEMPLKTGALLAGATDADIRLITDYSKHGGIAFQIIDDILGVFGTEESIGKSALSDVTEGKKTVLISHVLANGNAEQVEFIKRELGNKNITLEDFEKFKQILIDVGSLEYAKGKARTLMEKSNIALESQKHRLNTRSVEFLLGLNEYVLTRNK